MHFAFAALSIAFLAHSGIRPEIAGETSWRVVSEQRDAIVVYRETGRDERSRQIWLVVTGRISGEIEQGYFVHTLDCANWTHTRDEFGSTDPAPRSWTPEDGPPILRPAVVPEAIRDGSPIATIAEAVCEGRDLNLPTIEGDWETVTSALRERLTDLVRRGANSGFIPGTEIRCGPPQSGRDFSAKRKALLLLRAVQWACGAQSNNAPQS